MKRDFSFAGIRVKVASLFLVLMLAYFVGVMPRPLFAAPGDELKGLGLPALAQRLGQGNVKERLAVLYEMERFRDLSPVTAAILSSIGDADRNVRRAALYLTPRLQSTQANDALISRLKVETDVEILDQIFIALEKIHDSRAVPAIVPFFHNENERIRHAAFKAMRYFGDAGNEALLAALRDPEAVVWQEADQILDNHNGNIRTSLLLELLHDQNSHVVLSAGKKLMRSSDSRGRDALRALLQHPDSSIKQEAAIYLAYRDDKSGADVLADQLQTGTIKERMPAAQALAYLKDDRALPVLSEALSSTEEDTFKQAAWSLSLLGSTGALDLLLNAFRSIKPKIKQDNTPIHVGDKVFPGTGQEDTLISALANTNNRRATNELIDRLKQRSSKDSMRGVVDEFLHPHLMVMNDVLPRPDQYPTTLIRSLFNVREADRAGFQVLLSEKRPELRMMAIHVLGMSADPIYLPRFITALSDTDPWVRSMAARALGMLADVRALEPLLAALSDTNMTVREQAAAALGAIGDRRAVEPLLVALASKDDEVLAAVATALGALGDARAGEPLLALLTVASPDTFSKKSIITALGQLKMSDAVTPLIVLCKATDESICLVAVKALGEIGDARAIPVLSAMVNGVNLPKANAALTALGNIDAPEALSACRTALSINRTTPLSALSTTFIAMGVRAVPLLLQEISDPKTPDLATHLRTLLEILAQLPQAPPGVADALLPLLNNPNEETRNMVISSLGYTHDPRIVPAILPLLNNRNPMIVSAAISTIGNLNNPDEIEVLLPLLRHEQPDIRVYAALALGNLRDPVAIPALLNAVVDPNSWVKRMAMIALAPMADERCTDFMRGSLTDTDPSNRASAIQALDVIGVIDNMRLIQILASDKEPQVRRRVIEILARKHDPRVMDDLIASLQYPLQINEHKLPLVTRGEAIRLLGLYGGEQGVPALLTALEEGTLQQRGMAAEVLGKLKDPRAIVPLKTAIKNLSGNARENAVVALQQIGGKG